MGLPAFNRIKSKETLLKPLPMDLIYKEVGETLRRRENYEDWYLGEMFEMFKGVIDLVNGGRWHDWRYDLNAIHDWSDYQELIVELNAEKVNTEMRLTINKQYYFEAYEELNHQDLINDFMAFFEEAQQNIEQWNNISAYHKPIIAERPTFDKQMRFAFEEFMMEFERDYGYYKDQGYFNNFAEYELEKEVFPAEVFSMEVIEELMQSHYYGPHSGFSNVKILGMDHRYGYIIVDNYIATQNIGVKFKPSYIEIDSSESLAKDEWEEWFKEEVDKYYSAVVQWNEIVKGGK